MQEFKWGTGWIKKPDSELAKGDRVRWCIEREPDGRGPAYQQEGNIVSIREGNGIIVEFDEVFLAGHTGRGYAEQGRGWVCNGYELEVYKHGLIKLQPQVADSIENVEAQ